MDLRIALPLLFLQLCRATDTQCTVTQDAECTHYRVPESTHGHCEFHWLSGTHVLADLTGRTEQVERSNISTLDIKTCSPKIIYRWMCKDGVTHEVTCSFNCSVNPSPSKIGDSVLMAETHGMTGGHIAAVVVVTILVLALVLGLVCYMLRASLNRRKSCSPPNESSERLQQQKLDVESLHV